MSEEEQQTWFRNMWEGKEEQQEQAAQPSEPEPQEVATTEDNEFNDDDEFGDDFDDFAKDKRQTTILETLTRPTKLQWRLSRKRRHRQNSPGY